MAVPFDIGRADFLQSAYSRKMLRHQAGGLAVMPDVDDFHRPLEMCGQGQAGPQNLAAPLAIAAVDSNRLIVLHKALILTLLEHKSKENKGAELQMFQKAFGIGRQLRMQGIKFTLS